MAKVLIVNLEGKIGGAETSLLLLIKHLQNNHTISVACPGNSPLSEILGKMKTRMYELTNPTKHRYTSIRNLRYWFRTYRRLIQIIKQENPDIIHANSFYAGLPCVFAALFTRKKLVVHARDLMNSKLLIRFISAFCLKIIATSHNLKNDLIRKGVNNKKISVIHNGTDESDTYDNIYKNTKKDYFVFANVGQFVPWKKQINFLKASSLALKDIPDCRFALIGDDIFGRDFDYKMSIFNHTLFSPIKERIDFWGWQKDMKTVWPKIDCLVHCADREPFGRSIIEAMAHKIPVIAVNSYGPSEIIHNGNTGILVQPDDITELSEAMKTIYKNNRYANKLACAGYDKVASYFKAENTAKKVHELYDELSS